MKDLRQNMVLYKSHPIIYTRKHLMDSPKRNYRHAATPQMYKEISVCKYIPKRRDLSQKYGSP
uniref:Putative ovule protein n=1 Tax=Solanum chacoense TaxID=4108 RepID=A0A0V0GPJ2_SOLCH